MRPLSKRIVPLLTLLLAPAALARPQIDDADLSGHRVTALRQKPGPVLAPDAIESELAPEGGLSVQVLRETKRHGVARWEPLRDLALRVGRATVTTDAEGRARLPDCAGLQPVRLEAPLTHAGFSVQSDLGATYRIEAPLQCGQRVTLRFRDDTPAGQATGIFQIGARARQAFRAAGIDLAFWNRVVPFRWPSDGDYYSMGAVNVTRGDHWDIVGHELGHAIFDLAGIGELAGGSHKIDECYGEALAWSEGWASFFSAWISLEPGDLDARFEHLVPRRAPIRIENIPADVCAGPRNEWRVTGFLWDLLDLAADGENIEEAFARLWRGTLKVRASSALGGAQGLARAGLEPVKLQTSWELNFRQPMPR
jgi:hypothetical protein